MKIQEANQEHYPDIISIYNWAITNTSSTFDTEQKSLKNYGPFLNNFTSHPLLVAIHNEKTIGWGCLKPYSDRSAYNDTVELSIYISPDYHGKGIGSLMMEALLLKGEEHKFHTILSRITSDSDSSIKLHRKHGFNIIGTLKEVGYKFNRRIDVILMQKML